MRLFPVVGSGTTRRNLEKDMWLGGGKLFVPKGVLLWIPMHAVQNVSANWDEPDKFQPERWSQVSPLTPPPLRSLAFCVLRCFPSTHAVTFASLHVCPFMPSEALPLGCFLVLRQCPLSLMLNALPCLLIYALPLSAYLRSSAATLAAAVLAVKTCPCSAALQQPLNPSFASMCLSL